VLLDSGFDGGGCSRDFIDDVVIRLCDTTEKATPSSTMQATSRARRHIFFDMMMRLVDVSDALEINV